MTAPPSSREDARLSGRCLCGATRFTAIARDGRVFDVCHCSMCRRWAGGPWFGVEVRGFAAADPASVLRYRSSDWAERWACATCGGALAYALVDSDHVAVSFGALDDADGFVFKEEIFVDDQPATYAFANDVPRKTGAQVIAEFMARQDAEDASHSS